MKGARLFFLTALFCGLGSLGLFSVRSQGQSSGDQQARLIRNNNLGVAYMEQLSFEKASQQFASNVELDPRFTAGHVNLGIAEYYRQNYEPAIEAFEAALQIEPNQIRAHYMLGLIFRQTNQNPRAIESFLRVSQQDTDDPSTNYYLGLSYSTQRDYPRAIEYLSRAVEEQPYNASAHYNLGQAQMRSGKRAEAQLSFATFQKLREQFGSETVGLQYLEQGKYAAVMDHFPRLNSLDEGPSSNRFSADRLGEMSSPSPASSPDSLRYRDRADLEARIVPYIGSGASFGDANGDSKWDVLVAGYAGNRLYLNRAGSFDDFTSESGLAGSRNTMLALWGDFNNDLKTDLYLINYGANSLWLSGDNGRFENRTAQSGTGDRAWGVAGSVVDFDHDGDLDILVANLTTGPGSPLPAGTFPSDLPPVSNVLYRNNGDGTFTDVAEAAGLGASPQRSTSVWISDFDNSRDIDLIISRQGAGGQIWSNQRDGTFRELSRESLLSEHPSAILIPADLQPDGQIDLLSIAGAGTQLYVNQSNGKFERTSVSPLAIAADSGFGMTQPVDIDNDGDWDLVSVAGPRLLRSQHDKSPIVVWEKRSEGYVDVTQLKGLAADPSVETRGLSVADYDSDGDLDLLVGINGSAPMLLTNQGEAGNNWVQVSLEGTGSNRQGIGTKVEILAGPHWQKVEVQGGQGFLSQSPPVAHFGLGKNNHLDVIRLLWPGGVLQSEVDPAQNQSHRLRELDRKGTSCPILYVWNGSTYQFQTDFLGGSAVGYLLAPGTYNVPDPDEYIKLDPNVLKLRDGRVALTLNNQLEEVIFFDSIELIAVDHPSEIDIYPDEKLLPGPPYDPFRVITLSNPKPPVAARDGKGQDLLSEISRIDRLYPQFSRLPFKGYSETHELMLDLGPVSNERVTLLMHAWIDYADSTSNLAAAQSGQALIPPYLQIEDKNGNWVTVIERMGFPAGLPKAMTVDLSGRFLSASRRIRIVTNMRIYWDQILVDDSSADSSLRLQQLLVESAELSFKGFPRFYSPDGREPKIYDYQDISPTAPWKTHVGAYTQFGNVTPLLREAEDFFVVTRAGDQVEVQFDVRGLPQLQADWTRDYILHVTGFGKDMDVNSARPDFVGPLPFHGMPSYPYPEGAYPMDEAHSRYLKEWNTRIVEEWLPTLPVAARSPAYPPTPRQRDESR